MTARDGLAPSLDHARRMDRMYRTQRHIYDLTRKYYLFGRDRLIAGLDVPPGGTLLEVGCGTGRNLVLAGRRFPSARLHGLDISEAMLESARAKFRRAGAAPVLVAADAARFSAADFGLAGFDRIAISYALSMIPEWEKALDAALAALAPGGSLHIVDFGRQENLPGWFARALRAWLARFHVTPRDGLAEALGARLEGVNGTLVLESVGGGYACHAIVRRPAR